MSGGDFRAFSCASFLLIHFRFSFPQNSTHINTFGRDTPFKSPILVWVHVIQSKRSFIYLLRGVSFSKKRVRPVIIYFYILDLCLTFGFDSGCFRISCAVPAVFRGFLLLDGLIYWTYKKRRRPWRGKAMATIWAIIFEG